jgi:gamma-glutamylcyclotransferase (GGCT)/AIG2-like uncharacterized protein YtfP
MRGECRFGVRQEAGLECTLLAESHGHLFDLDEYPAMVVVPGDRDVVQGEFVRLSNPALALEELDQIEGFHGYGEAGSLYRRVLIDVHVGDGRIRRAWTYVMSSEPTEGLPIDSGDWREHRGRRASFLRALAAHHAGDTPNKLIARLANQLPLSFASDQQDAIAELSPLDEALSHGILSERKLAQESGCWVAVP